MNDTTIFVNLKGSALFIENPLLGGDQGVGLGQANLKLNQSFLQIYARRCILKTGIFVLRNIIVSLVYHFSNSSCLYLYLF